MKGIARGDDAECAVGERQRQDVADAPAHVGQALIALEYLGLLDHRGGEVDARRVADDAGKGADDVAATARHVEDRVSRARAARLDEQRQACSFLMPGDVENGTAWRVNWSRIASRWPAVIAAQPRLARATAARTSSRVSW